MSQVQSLNRSQTEPMKMGGPTGSTGPANWRLYQKVVQNLDSKLQLHGNSVSVYGLFNFLIPVTFIC